MAGTDGTLIRGFAEDRAPGGIPDHRHEDCAQLIYAEAGLVSVVTPGERWLLPPGRALWIPLGMLHRLEIRRPSRLNMLYFSARAEGLPGWERCIVLNVSPLLRALIVHAAGLGAPAGPGSAEARLARVLLDQIAASPHAPVNLPEPADPRAARLARLLRERPDERRPLAELAPLAGASPRTLQRLFLAETGTGFGSWRNRLRLLSALERMAGGESVTAAAHAVGYDNPSSLIAAFRAMFGTTPRHYLGPG